MKDETAEILRFIKGLLKPHQILTNVPMKEHTSMRVGGAADIMVLPSSTREIIEIKNYLQKSGVSHYVMGNGTNLIVSDTGYKGVIIKISDNYSDIAADRDEITAQAGAYIVAVSNLALKNSLAGLEFAAGIPGTVGGAVAMNAGAYDGEMKDVVSETLCINEAGEEIAIRGEEHEFGYRTSRIQKERLVVLEVKMKLEKGDPLEISEKMRSFNQRRREKQPLNLPSAGSVFKRPEGFFAGKLIQDAGLSGFRIGGAQVSEKHCGFIVNTGGATASDIIDLVRHIQETVYRKAGVMLEPEVRILGG